MRWTIHTVLHSCLAQQIQLWILYLSVNNLLAYVKCSNLFWEMENLKKLIYCVLWPSVTAAWPVFVLYREADAKSWISILFTPVICVSPPLFLNNLGVKPFSIEILKYSFGILVIKLLNTNCMLKVLWLHIYICLYSKKWFLVKIAFSDCTNVCYGCFDFQIVMPEERLVKMSFLITKSCTYDSRRYKSVAGKYTV